MNIALATGGSLGHIMPAVLLGKNLKELGHNVYMVGALRRWSNIISSYGFEIYPVEAKPIGFSFSSLKALFNSYTNFRDYFKTVDISVVVGFGSYASVPGVIAGKSLGAAIILHEQNVVPGRANKFLKIMADRIAISFRDTSKYFPKKKVSFTGCPCVFTGAIKRTAAMYSYYGLQEDIKTILVFGGSQGSKGVNQLFINSLNELKKDTLFQVLHICGNNDDVVQQDVYNELGLKACIFPFIDDMGPLYALADVVVARSGALTVTELATFKKKAILLPYPHAGAHQLQNAQLLKDTGLAEIFSGNNPVKFAQALKQQLNKSLEKCIDQKILQESFKTNAVHLLTEEVLCANS